MGPAQLIPSAQHPPSLPPSLLPIPSACSTRAPGPPLPAVLRFLIASREEVDSVQLRDDLLSMLVAGHETTGSVLTWTVDLLARSPDKLRKVRRAGGGRGWRGAAGEGKCRRLLEEGC